MARYKNTTVGNSTNIKYGNKDKPKYNTTFYSKIPLRNDDIYLISTEGDRLDNLAFQFYKDASLWWYIAKANNLSFITIPTGTSLRIPATTKYATII